MREDRVAEPSFRGFSNGQRLVKQLLCIPVHEKIMREHVNYVTAGIRDFYPRDSSVSTSLFATKEIVAIGEEELRWLRQAAILSPTKRARLCLHQDHREKVQEMVIAVCKDSYMSPHRQMEKYKSYKIVEGELIIAFFDDKGKIIRTVEMAPSNGAKTFVYRFSSCQWHTVVSVSDIAIYVETISGPYIKEETEFARWAPAEADRDGVRALLRMIRS